MTSLAEASSSVGTEGNPQETENPMPAGAGPSAGVAANGTEPAADVQKGVDADRMQATPPTEENDEAASAGTGGAAKTDTSMFNSPVFLQFPLCRR